MLGVCTDDILERVACIEVGTVTRGMNGEMLLVIYARADDPRDLQRMEDTLLRIKETGYIGTVLIREVVKYPWWNPRRITRGYRVKKSYFRKIGIQE